MSDNGGRAIFNVFDVVRVSDTPSINPHDKYIVISIREYPSERFRYRLSPLDPTSDLDAVLLDEEGLTGTGERSDASRFDFPGKFLTRDVAMIASDYPDVELAGHECQVDSANVVDGVIETLVWIPDIELMAVVEEDYLTATGRREKPPLPGRIATSTRVSTGGEVLGEVSYVIVDDVESHL